MGGGSRQPPSRRRLTRRRPRPRGGNGMLIAPALAMLDAIDAVPGLAGRAGIRWINDVLIDGAKVGGVIVRTRSQGTRLTDALMGMGLDVERAPEVEPDVFVPRVGALRDYAGAATSCSLADLFRCSALRPAPTTERTGGGTIRRHARCLPPPFHRVGAPGRGIRGRSRGKGDRPRNADRDLRGLGAANRGERYPRPARAPGHARRGDIRSLIISFVIDRRVVIRKN